MCCYLLVEVVLYVLGLSMWYVEWWWVWLVVFDLFVWWVLLRLVGLEVMVSGLLFVTALRWLVLFLGW